MKSKINRQTTVADLREDDCFTLQTLTEFNYPEVYMAVENELRKDGSLVFYRIGYLYSNPLEHFKPANPRDQQSINLQSTDIVYLAEFLLKSAVFYRLKVFGIQPE